MADPAPTLEVFRPPAILRTSDLADEYIQEMEAALLAKAEGRDRGPKMGIYGVDQMFGGYFPPGLYLLHGEPGSGKSAWAAQLATTCRVPSIYVTVEMSPLELVRRHVARVTHTMKPMLLEARLSREEELELLRKALATAPDWTVIDGSSRPVHHDFIADEVRWLRLDRSAEHVVVVIDSLHAWSRQVASFGSDVGRLSEMDVLSEAISAALSLAREERIVVIMLAHRNRESRKQGGLAAVRGSSNAEYLADVILDLSLAVEGQRNDVMREVRLSAPKNRFGQVGAGVKLMFNTNTQGFAPLEERRYIG